MSPTFASCLLFFILIVQGARGATFMLINKCGYTVWPGVLANAGSAGLDTTGFELAPGASRGFQVTSSWSGRIWGRTGCNFDAGTGQGSCATGDCRSNQVECNGAGATPPATLAEFTIGSSGADNKDFYDVSLVDGYNLPMQVEAIGGTGACGSTGCAADVNRICPKELRSGDGLACRSACDAFGNAEYCCSGAYGSPSTCQPSMYSEMFKNACPRSYSYAYDDATSTFTCSGADYRITFCPSTTSGQQKSSSSLPAAAGASSASGPPATAAEDSGPQDGIVFGNSWLGFITGESSTTMSHFVLHSKSALTSAIAFFILSFLHLLLVL